jgi:hypothetical protein
MTISGSSNAEPGLFLLNFIAVSEMTVTSPVFVSCLQGFYYPSGARSTIFTRILLRALLKGSLCEDFGTANADMKGESIKK